MFKHSIYLILLVFVLLGCSSDSSSDTSVTDKPEKTFTISTDQNSYRVGINGEAGSKIYLNSEEIATMAEHGRGFVDLNTSYSIGTSKEFRITLKNSEGLETGIFIYIIEKKDAKVSRLAAIKLLRQASFTSFEPQIQDIMMNGDIAWIDKQLEIVGDLDDPSDDKYGFLESLTRWMHVDKPAEYPESIFSDPASGFPETKDNTRYTIFSRSLWWEKSLHNEDQLRQRVAYALSQILVAGNGVNTRGETLSHYYDILVKNAFGNYRDLLKDVTMTPMMSRYLTFLTSSKENNVTGTAPDENYARELMQLFTVGLYEQDEFGIKQRDAYGFRIPIYTQDDVSELARVFTGWTLSSNHYDGDGRNNKYFDDKRYAHSFILPIRSFDEYHDFGAKIVLGETIVADLTPEQDIDRALDILMQNPNIGPYVCRELINRLVTSNPTPAYMGRVVAAFNSTNGVKGDLKATVRAILTDDEARLASTSASYGKVDEYAVLTTHYLSSINIKPYPNVDLGDRSKSKYWFKQTYQTPMHAPSVFNFYSPEYIPNDPSFSDEGLVAPEFEIRTNNTHVAFSNTFYFYAMRSVTFLSEEDKREMYTVKSGDLNGLTVDFGEYYHELSSYVDGNYRNLYKDNKGTEMGARGEVAIEKFIDYVHYRLTGRDISDEDKASIKGHLMSSNYHANYANSQAKNIVKDTIRSIIMLPSYMVIK